LFESNIENYLFNISSIDPKTFILYYHIVFLRNQKRKERSQEFYDLCAELLKIKEMAEWYLTQINESFVN
jgi:hypothetical protein